MQLKIDGYTKFILTVIAIALLLNVGMAFMNMVSRPAPVYAGDNQMKITDVHTTWPIEIKVTNWPREYEVKQR